MAGDSNVGKTHLVSKYTKGELPRHSAPTIGISYSIKILSLKDGKNVKAHLWDTAGQEQYRSVTKAKAVGAVVVFDVTSKESFDSIDNWINDVREYAEKSCVITLLGNKIDLESERKVTKDQASNYAKSNGISYFETSAITDLGMNEAFSTIIESKLEYKTRNR